MQGILEPGSILHHTSFFGLRKHNFSSDRWLMNVLEPAKIGTRLGIGGYRCVPMASRLHIYLWRVFGGQGVAVGPPRSVVPIGLDG